MVDSTRSNDVTALLHEVMKLLKTKMNKHLEDYGITVPQSMILRILGKSGKMKISDLSSKMSLSNSTVSGILDRLEKQEIVERTRSEEDRRIVYVSLSPKFEKIHQNFHKQMEEYVKNMIGEGSPDEINTIIEGLSILKRLLGG